ncbi:unnamed protein product [Pieris macdunnoughi]|uniref:Reverse transcriptase domain-containing protein n=1 Tax=Pieris macdunnoughi TaxID=345717 RepID=A0A821X4R2_9NEOP|nr:unnamed protein product [Pieris macdunnoughi]
MQEAVKRKIAVALVQEPYIGAIGKMKDYPRVRVVQCQKPQTGEVVKAAVVIFDADIDIIQYPEITTANTVPIKIKTAEGGGIALVSYYMEPAPKLIEPYLKQLDEVASKIRKRIILGGDANAKSPWWGSPVADDRGEAFENAVAQIGLHIINDGQEPTFEVTRRGKRIASHLDITVCSQDLLGHVEDWRVDPYIATSDHNAILFKINMTKAKIEVRKGTTRIYNTRKANWTLFKESLLEKLNTKHITELTIQNINSTDKLEETINLYSDAVIAASDTAIPKIKTGSKPGLAWWTEELERLKKRVVTMKRRIRWAAECRRQKVINDYLEAKENYENKAEEAQTQSWKQYCQKQERETMWEGIYRVIRGTERRKDDIPLTDKGKQLDEKQSAELLAKTFFPEDDTRTEDDGHRKIREKAETVNEGEHDANHDPHFTMKELTNAAQSFNPRKAPGEDGITADIGLNAITAAPGLFLAIANKCLELGTFPEKWKKATIVVLRKPAKANYDNPKSYRPIGLLPVMGKIFEKMVVERLKWYLVPKTSKHQFGFMPQRSTEDALYTAVNHIRRKLIQKKILTVVSLDIEGAFDSAWWPMIRVRLAEEKCPRNIRKIMDSYLMDRKIKLTYAGQTVERDTTKGCVQGSIGGPILWNLLLDPLLREIQETGVHVQAFADDILLISEGETGQDNQTKLNKVLARVYEWGSQNKLRFAPHKTKAMVVTRKLKIR